MDATLEVRWFGTGTPPDAIQDWFDTLDAGSESGRTDHYLYTADPGLNVKLREGKAQTKRRLAGGRPFQVGASVAGRAESWRKFSFKTKSKSQLDDDEHATGLWMPVEKARRQRTVEGEALATIIGDDVDVSGMEANIELTRTRMDDALPGLNGAPEWWWSICVESEGAPDRLTAVLEPAAQHFFEGFPTEHALRPDDSFGYAEWLIREWSPPAVTEDATPAAQSV